jgi:Alginate export
MSRNLSPWLTFSAGLLFAICGTATAQEPPRTPAAPPGVNPYGVPINPQPYMVFVPVQQPTAPGTAPMVQGGQPMPPAAAVQEVSPSCPATWHDHKYPTLPLAPAAGLPVPPTGCGYYTLLDALRGTPTDGPPRFPYSKVSPIFLPFFDTNFTYLDSIPFEDRDWSEKLKRIPLGDHWLFSTGGEIRERYYYLKNAFLTGSQDSNSQTRLRVYGDLWYEDIFRFYVEGIFTNVDGSSNPPQTRDIDTVDLLNAFFDVKLIELDGNPIYGRVGRQQLIYGSQRLVSTIDFANNGPRYDAAKFFYRSEKWDVDLFGGRPIIIQNDDLGIEDHNRWFSGAWATWKPKPGMFFDFYYLNLYNKTPGVATGEHGVVGSFDVNTIGSRATGRADCGFLWDFEGAAQFGNWSNQSIGAAMADAYVGWNFKNAPLDPTVWLGYDYASGGSNTGSTHNTFNQLFNFAHYYYGSMDIIGRQNIQDATAQGYVYPAKWWLAGLQYHYLHLADDRAPLFSASGVVERVDPTGKAGGDVGSIICAVSNFHLTNRQDIFFQYSHFFPGSYINNTPGTKMSADAVNIQYSWRW